MPNKPRPDNPHRSVRVERDLWEAAGKAAQANGTTRAAIIQEALRRYVKRPMSAWSAGYRSGYGDGLNSYYLAENTSDAPNARTEDTP